MKEAQTCRKLHKLEKGGQKLAKATYLLNIRNKMKKPNNIIKLKMEQQSE